MSTKVDALAIVVRCDTSVERRVRYVFDTLFLASGILVQYVDAAPPSGPWLLYAAEPTPGAGQERALFVQYDPAAWRHFDEDRRPEEAHHVDGLALVFPACVEAKPSPSEIRFDLPANAFYFLSSWAERRGGGAMPSSRQLHAASEFVRLVVPQDIVDRYLMHLLDRLRALFARLGAPTWPLPEWPGGKAFAVVLSHDVDFVPVRPLDNVVQGAKSVLRHLVRQRDPADAWRAALGWLAATASGRDPYGCVPEIIAREQALGMRSSFQVAVGHRHANDVNYRIEDDRVRDYLRAITDAGFDLCLHGSYCSTENRQWYVDEAELLARRLGRPLGSRQHFLSFDYDNLFLAQEAADVRYDMSMGFPDQPGPRSGFSYPYFPYNLREDRAYHVLEIGLFIMDVTLRSYLGLRPGSARHVVDACLNDLRDRRGSASVVWHPIVFGGARDPGYDTLFFDMAARVGEMGGLATDGRTVDNFWRAKAIRYDSFTFA